MRSESGRKLVGNQRLRLGKPSIIFASVLAGTVFLMGSASSALSTSEWFKDRDGSYRFKPPPRWKHIYLGEATVQFFAPEADANYKPGLLIFRGPGVQAGGVGGYRYATQESDGDHAGKRINSSAILQAIKKEKAQARVVREDSFPINGADVYLVTYEHRFQQLHMKAAEATLVDFTTGNDFVILFNTLAETFDKYYPLFRQSLDTFTVASKPNYNHQLLVEKVALRNKASVLALAKEPFKPSNQAFRIKPPEGWHTVDQGDIVSFASAKEGEWPRAVILVSRTRVSGKLPEGYKHRTQTKEGIDAWLKEAGYDLKSVKHTKVSGHTALEIQFHGINARREAIRGIIYRIFTPEAHYDIKFSTEPVLFDKALPTFELSLASFSAETQW